jgi:hypothetical protein
MAGLDAPRGDLGGLQPLSDGDEDRAEAHAKPRPTRPEVVPRGGRASILELRVDEERERVLVEVHGKPPPQEIGAVISLCAMAAHQQNQLS